MEIGWLGGQVAPEQGPALPTFLVLLWAVTLVTATSSAVNEREVLRRRYDLDALARMSDRLERTHDLHTVAEIVVDAVVDTFGGRRAAVVSIRMDEPTPLAGHDLAPVAGSASVTGVLAQVRDSRSTALVSGLGEADAWLALLPGTSLEDARVVAERIRRSVAVGPSSVPVTISIGAARVGHGTSATDAVRAADLALYDAKHDGRNRVHVSRPAQPGGEQRGEARAEQPHA